MPRVYTTKKARKDHGRCRRCGTEILKGQTFYYYGFAFGADHKHCVNCFPKPAELTQSEIKQTAYSIAEEGFDQDTIDDLRDRAEEIRGEIEELAELLQEKMDAIEEGMGHPYAPVYEELDERRDAIEGWAQEMESVVDNAPEELEMDEMDDDDMEIEAHEQEVEAWREELREVLATCPE